MKKLLLFITIIFLTARVSAQVVPHEVSGIVKDSTDNAVIGAWVTLTSPKDTLKASTNPDGVFIFHNVKSGQFTITVKSLGFINYNKRFLYNDATRRLVLDPIILKSQSNILSEVKINGTPSITYKEDTVEYRASDYKVRENATVDELLKKMEGVEVGTDGSVTAQGLQVARARVNGKDYSGGDVATAIQNLPADIVEKIQIVDDYGDQAARTGIKDGDPQKVLNIVTKANKSVGNTARITGGAGNNERYEGRVFAQRFNGNQQIGVQATLNNTITGVAGNNNTSGLSGAGGGNSSGGNRGGGGGAQGSSFTGGGASIGGSGGTATSGRYGLSYRDQWGKKINVNTSYSYGFNNNNSLNNSSGVENSTLGALGFISNSESESDSKNHNFNFELEYDISKKDFLRIQPSLTYSESNSLSSSGRDQEGYLMQRGADIATYNRQINNAYTNNLSNTPSYGGTLFYQHMFAKQGRNLSLQLSYNESNAERVRDRNTDIIKIDSAQVNDVIDTAGVHNIINNDNISKTARASFTFSEPLSKSSRLELNTQVNRRSYDNIAVTDSLDINDRPFRVDRLSNIYNYSFTETRIALNYRFTKTKYNFSLGLTAVPALLEGSKQSLGTHPRRTSFNMVPIARFQYSWTRQQRFSINYSGSPTEPTFDQIQPVRDVSNPQRPVLGNEKLKPSFRHSINTSYNNYISRSKLTFQTNGQVTITENRVISNIVDLRDSIYGYIKETRYINKGGSYSANGNYSISKQLADRKYSVSLNGFVNFNNNVSMSNDVDNTGRTWTFEQRFRTQVNPTEWFEMNPSLKFNYLKADFSLPSSTDIRTKTWAFGVDGRIYFSKTLVFGYNGSKNWVRGISSNVTNNPFIINTSLEKQFFKRRNGALSLQAYDLMNQNNFINRNINENGYTDTKSNALSRYYMLSFRWTPQKWTGAAASRNGRQLMRRGDGSFY